MRQIPLFTNFVSESAIFDTSDMALMINHKIVILYKASPMSRALDDYDYDAVSDSIVGCVDLDKNEVDSIWATHGFGPLLLLIAMQVVKPKYLIMTRQINATTDDAKNVWFQFVDGKGKNMVNQRKMKYPDADKEWYMNVELTNKVPIDIDNMMLANQNVIGDDVHGERFTTILEHGEIKLMDEMNKIYGNK